MSRDAPLVPKLTRCSGLSRSGRRSIYSPSSRARSTSISLGAGLPASGEMVMHLLFNAHGCARQNFGGVLGEVVAGELPAAGHVQGGLGCRGVADGVHAVSLSHHEHVPIPTAGPDLVGRLVRPWTSPRSVVVPFLAMRGGAERRVPHLVCVPAKTGRTVTAGALI
jgi:hypothetical protein